MSSGAVKVVVEYCGGWGYGPRYQELRQKILGAVPSADITGNVGRRTSFEVTVNDIVIFSKLEKGSFPDFDMVAQSVAGVAQGEKPKMVTECQKSSCVLL